MTFFIDLKHTITFGVLHPVAENRLNRQFEQPLPNQAWAADITYVPTAEGWLYLAAVIDLCSRKIVGWNLAPKLTTELALTALKNALDSRKPAPGLIHHDRQPGTLNVRCANHDDLAGGRQHSTEVGDRGRHRLRCEERKLAHLIDSKPVRRSSS